MINPKYFILKFYFCFHNRALTAVRSYRKRREKEDRLDFRPNREFNLLPRDSVTRALPPSKLGWQCIFKGCGWFSTKEIFHGPYPMHDIQLWGLMVTEFGIHWSQPRLN